MTHPLRVAENCTTHPLHKAQNLMTHPLSAPAHLPPPLYFLTSPLTDEGIDTQRVLGTAVGSRSGKREIVNSAKNSSELLQEVVKEAIENEYLITLMINDWTKVYTKRRATDESTSVADNFCTVISRLSKTSRPFHGRRLKPFTTTRELMWKVYLFFFFHSPLLKTFLSHM